LLRHGFLNHRMNGLNPCGCESTLLARYKDDVLSFPGLWRTRWRCGVGPRGAAFSFRGGECRGDAWSASG
jgi:hypothetical protein